MTLKEMTKLFGPDDSEDGYEENSEHLHFERIVNPKHRASGFTLRKISSCSAPPMMSSSPGTNSSSIRNAQMSGRLAAVVTPEVVRDLHRCGVRYDTFTGSLAMFA